MENLDEKAALRRLRAAVAGAGEPLGNGSVFFGDGEPLAVTLHGDAEDPSEHFGLEPEDCDDFGKPLWCYQWREFIPDSWEFLLAFAVGIDGGYGSELLFHLLEPGDGRLYYIVEGDVDSAEPARVLAAIEPGIALDAHQAFARELFASEGGSAGVQFGTVGAARISVSRPLFAEAIRSGFVSAARRIRAEGRTLAPELEAASDAEFDAVAGARVVG